MCFCYGIYFTYTDLIHESMGKNETMSIFQKIIIFFSTYL